MVSPSGSLKKCGKRRLTISGSLGRPGPVPDATFAKYTSAVPPTAMRDSSRYGPIRTGLREPCETVRLGGRSPSTDARLQRIWMGRGVFWGRRRDGRPQIALMRRARMRLLIAALAALAPLSMLACQGCRGATQNGQGAVASGERETE